jgi:hypothetical protein
MPATPRQAAHIPPRQPLKPCRRVRRAQHRAHRSRRDVRIHADAEDRPPVVGAAFDIGGGLRVCAVADRMLAIIDHVERRPGRRERGDHARDQAVAAPGDRRVAPSIAMRPTKMRSPAAPLSS